MTEGGTDAPKISTFAGKFVYKKTGFTERACSNSIHTEKQAAHLWIVPIMWVQIPGLSEKTLLSPWER